jgi:predicted HicB family RNase H-like nuclease
MSFVVEIEGYRARVERGHDGMLYGRVLEMEDLVYFKAATQRLVETKFAKALEMYFEMCKQRGIEPRKPMGPRF